LVNVELSRTARKQLTKVPSHIVRKFALWVDLVQVEGLEAARAVPGYRDHGLKGTWQGYRAVRLSDAYRAIYIVQTDGSVEAVHVEEVNKHDY
jgi:toxin HigB-1